MDHVRAVLAVLVRNLRVARRRPDLVVQAAAVPVVVLALAGLVFGADDSWPVAVLDDDRTPASREVAAAIDDVRGASGPYLDVVTTDPLTARAMVADGRLHAVVRIPEGFAGTGRLEATTYNINTDAMKNVRLRLVQLQNLVDQRRGEQPVSVDLHLDGPTVVSRNAFMGTTAVALALLLGAALVTANLVAFEQESRTSRELVLTPLGAATGLVGAACSGVVLAVPAAAATALVATALGLRPAGVGPAWAALVLGAAMLGSAGVGALLAQVLRTHRAIQPVVILTALAGWFGTGGFVPVAGLPPAARAVSAVWPPSYVFEWTASLVHGFADPPAGAQLAALAAVAALGLVLAAVAGLREQRRAVPGGQ